MLRADPQLGGATGAAERQGPLTIPLHQIAEDQRWVVGGKAANLAILMRAGFPVPPAFCVTSAAFTQFASARNGSDSLSGVPVPVEVEAAVLAAWRGLGEEKSYAVRSSASSEDGPGASFAGQFESYLNVRGRDALLEAIKKCWLSLFSPRALAYRAKEGLTEDKAAMAVLVQEMVPAQTAGVLFTIDPVSGDTGHMVLESIAGLGDRLVAGQVNPERLVLEKSSLRVIHRQSSAGVGSQLLDSSSKGPGTDANGVLRRARPTFKACLDDKLVRKLGQLALKAEQLFKQPLDIEWAAVEGQLFLLQARPATATPKPKSWDDCQLWTNINTGEIAPDVATPMTWSMVQKLLAPFFGSIFRLVGADPARAPIAGLVAGRIYWNANTGLAAMKPFLPFLKGIPDATKALGGSQGAEYERELLPMLKANLPDLGFRWHKYVLSWPRIILDLIAHSPRRGDAWSIRLQAQVGKIVSTEMDALSAPELIALFQRFLEEEFKAWNLLYFATQLIALPVFQMACQRWLNDPNLTMGYRLFAGMGGVPETEAGLALWQLAMLAQSDPDTAAMVDSDQAWPEVQSCLVRTEHGRRFLSGWTTFMSEHGHHCRGQLELSNRRWPETPDYILGLVRGYLRAQAQTSPLEKQKQLAEERLKLTAECRERLRNPIKRWLFTAALRRAQKLAVIREVAKNEAVRVVAFLRRVLLVLGRRFCERGILAEPDDIFFLEYSELKPVEAGAADFNVRERVLARRREYAKNLTLSPPQVVLGKFNPDKPALPCPTVDANATVLEGIAVSPGIVTGPARVILHTDDHEQVLPGEILVAPFTDPAWTPYFLTAAGVVMDQGGILSHGSIVAREFGLPAVTNAGSATQIVRTGDIVEVDGNRGRVTILQRAAANQSGSTVPIAKQKN